MVVAIAVRRLVDRRARAAAAVRRFDTSIEGVSWVLTAYNVAVAVAAIALVLFVHRAARVARARDGHRCSSSRASVACAAAGSLDVPDRGALRPGVGAALLLAGALPVLVALTGSPAAGAAVWTLAGTFGAALGPALGGVLTQAFDWRAIFVVQAPVAALGADRRRRPRPRGGARGGLAAGAPPHDPGERLHRPALRRARRACSSSRSCS